MDRFAEEPRIRTSRAWTSPPSTAPIARSPSSRRGRSRASVRDAETRPADPGRDGDRGRPFGLEPDDRRTDLDRDRRTRAITVSSGLPKEGATGHKLAVYPPLDQPVLRHQAASRPPPGPDSTREVRHRAQARHLDHRQGDRRGDRQAGAGLGRLLPVADERSRQGLPELRPEHHGFGRHQDAVQDRQGGRFPHRRAARAGRGHGPHRRQVVPDRASGPSRSRGGRDRTSS